MGDKIEPFILAISGPTSAGKTFFSKQLQKVVNQRNITITVISTDDFYNDLSHLSMEERNQVNYDHPDSINQEEFLDVISKLSENKSAKIPVYDFSIHNRSEEYRQVDPAQLIIVEGIFSLSFEAINLYYSLKLYVDLEPDIRLIRRIRRDRRERGRTLDSILNQYTDTVRPTQEEYVINDKFKADVIILGDNDNDMLIELICNYLERSK